MGVSIEYQNQGLGGRLLAQALQDWWNVRTTVAFRAVIVDCIDAKLVPFYCKRGFAEIPGIPLRLFLSAERLDQIMTAS